MLGLVGIRTIIYLQRDNLTSLNFTDISLKYKFLSTPVQFGNLTLAVIRKWKTMPR